MNINLKEIQIGDVFSEESHYIVTEVTKDSVKFNHLESGREVKLSNEYVKNLLNTSDQYEKEVKVGKEDKKDGTPGIRSIFESIKSSEVFTVVFKKQDKPKSKKELNEEIDYLIDQFSKDIDKVKASKKGVAEKAKQLITELIREPILPYEKGEDRVLRGFKMQFVSRDGKYRCMDMDIKRTDKETGERLVNINTISVLVYNGVKYVVE